MNEQTSKPMNEQMNKQKVKWMVFMMKVKEMVVYVSEMKWDLHDNHSHQNDMAFVHMIMKMRKIRNLEVGTHCPTLMNSFQGVFYL